MPITVTGGRELVDGGWSHAGLHTTLTPGPNTELDGAVTVFVAERLFQRRGDIWFEEGLDETELAGARRIDLGRSPELLERHPELRSVAMLERAVLRLQGEIVEVVADTAAE